MEEARNNPALQDHVAAFLDDQRSLIAIQKHHLNAQFPPQMRQLYLGLWEKRLGVLLRIATAFTGLAVAAGLAYLVWNAAASNDLVIDSFAVPPDLAARGLSGPVVAAKLSDKIATMQAETTSTRPAKSYDNGLSDGLKLEIPETGISLSELDRFLREQLGHDLHIGGEMVQTDKGVAITARVGIEGSATVAGVESETDSLIQKLAEQVYRITQPYRYALWLQGHGRDGEAIAVFKMVATNGPKSERPWAYNGWAGMSWQFENASTALALLQRARALDPNFHFPLVNMALIEERLGRMQDSLRDNGLALALTRKHGSDYAPQTVSIMEHNARSAAFADQGALLEAADQNRQAIAVGANGRNPFLAENLAALHEPSHARIALAEAPAALHTAQVVVQLQLLPCTRA